MILADWAYDCYNERKLDLLVENDEEAIDDLKRVENYVMIEIWCIQEDPSLRPMKHGCVSGLGCGCGCKTRQFLKK